MRKSIILITILLSFVFAGCSSIEDDAKKAAELNKESVEHTRANNLDKAKEAYDKSQAIISLYKGTDEYDKFYKTYLDFLYGENGQKK